MEDRVEPNREEQILEVLVVLFLIVPSIVLSFFFSSGLAAVSFTLVALSTIFRDLALLALVVFFLWRNGETGASIGWTTRSLSSNFLIGAVATPVVIVGISALDAILRSLGLSGPTETPQFLVPHGSAELALAFILVVVVAVSEETIFRGYLMSRFSRIGRGIAGHLSIAVVLSSVIFAIGHGYEGTAGLLSVGVMGFIFALLLLWRKSLIPAVVIHFLNDFIAIVLLPLLS